MDVQGLLQAHHQPGPVELHGQDGIAIAVLTYVSACVTERQWLLYATQSSNNTSLKMTDSVTVLGMG